MGKLQIKQCVCWKARQHPVTDSLYIRALQITVPEIIIAGPHFFVRSVLASNAHVETCIGARYRMISGRHDIARSTNL